MLRLAGLYNLERGAHNYWLTGSKNPIQPDGIINQVHYEDAAGACLAALQAKGNTTSGRVFLISDGHPQTRREICESALQAARYRESHLPEFAAPGQGGGKIYDGTASNAALQWKPRYESFDAFMKSMA